MNDKIVITLCIVIPIFCIWLCLNCLKCYCLYKKTHSTPNIIDEIPIDTNV